MLFFFLPFPKRNKKCVSSFKGLFGFQPWKCMLSLANYIYQLGWRVETLPEEGTLKPFTVYSLQCGLRWPHVANHHLSTHLEPRPPPQKKNCFLGKPRVQVIIYGFSNHIPHECKDWNGEKVNFTVLLGPNTTFIRMGSVFANRAGYFIT